ncbi:glycosyltransferase [Meiothermus sp. QL-1]|uniref:glycosyltransferase n=1 Tax=Meiothermus sp. QL-1 TaxID=2058095 RepID=UPI001314696B|nr:glycosyltransferase [Meiothermus sp. QL-1]
MRVWAVVPTHNRPSLLRECLEALQKQTYPIERILVVLNASPPEVKSLLAEFPEVERLELEQNEGSAGGFYHGMRRALEQGADWVWLMDDDGIPHSNALEKLLEAEQVTRPWRGPADLLLCRVVWVDGQIHPMNFPLPDWRRPGLLWKAVRYGYLAVRSGAWTGMLVRSQSILQHGLPNPAYFVWCEDLEFSGRVLRRGLGYWVHDSVVVHKTSQPTAAVGDYGERFFFEARNRVWLLRSKAFGGVGKFYWLLHFMGEIVAYLWQTRLAGWRTLARGLWAGLTQSPKK